MMMRRAFAVVTVAFMLTACAGLGDAGSAATVGTVQISTDDLSDQTRAVQEQRGVPAGAADYALTLGVLQRLIITELVDQAAATQGITISQGDIDTATAELEAQLGGAEALQVAFLDSDVPAAGIPRQVELSLQVQRLGAALAPEADANSQQQAVVQYVTGLSIQEGVEVSPRFGTWDEVGLTVGPLPSDLSTAEGAVNPLAEIVPAP